MHGGIERRPLAADQTVTDEAEGGNREVTTPGIAGRKVCAATQRAAPYSRSADRENRRGRAAGLLSMLRCSRCPAGAAPLDDAALMPAGPRRPTRQDDPEYRVVLPSAGDVRERPSGVVTGERFESGWVAGLLLRRWASGAREPSCTT